MTAVETVDPRTGFHDDIPEQAYHADRGSLSVSGAKVLINESPADFRYQQDHPVHKTVFDFGSAAHALILGAGIESIYVAPFADWRTKAAQHEKATGQDDGLSVILPKDWDVVCDMADVLSSHTLAMQLLSDGRPEVSAYAVDPETGVLRRGRFDWLGPTILTDYKTAASSAPSAFRKAAADNGYHMQAAFYLDLARDLGHPAEAFAFIVQRKTPPYPVNVIELDEASVERGRELNRRALQMYRDCAEADVWPNAIPDTTFTTVTLPPWAFYDDGDN